jgi:formate hydrogenlyase transcriptional activator
MNQNLEQTYHLLLRLNNAIINKSSRDSLFKAIGYELSNIFKYDRFSINLYDSKKDTLTLFASADGIVPNELDIHERPSRNGPISKYVIETNEPLLIKNLQDYQDWPTARAMFKAGLESTIACPLKTRNNILGSMNISYRNTPPNIESLVDLFVEISGQVALAVDNMLAHTKMQSLNESLKEQKNYLLQEIENTYDPDHFFFTSSQMWDVITQLDIFAKTDDPILITGETGTGKDYLARYIHNRSNRRDNMFVKVSCPSLAPSLFESELFGHAKGAFTGADTKKIGRLEMANGGTLFLDEIGELPLSLQAKLLQVLQEYSFERVGENHPITVNFRIITATNKDLNLCISNNEFRSDLFYRLETLYINVPPLRERSDEIPHLIKKVNEAESIKINKNPPIYTPGAMDILTKYSWPGNVRELKNLIKRLIILKAGQKILKDDVQNLIKNDEQRELNDYNSQSNSFDISEVERNHIQSILKLTHGKISGPKGAAALLNIPRTTLQYKLKKHRINPNLFKI